MILPPAASIAARAPLVTLMPLSVTALATRAREHDLGALGLRRHDAGLLQCLDVDGLALDLRELTEPDFGARRCHRGAEADFRQPPLNGHLAALEAHLVIAALARALSLDAAAAGLALAGRGAASDAQPGPLGAGRGLQSC